MGEHTDTAYNPHDEHYPKHPGGNTTQVMWNEKVNLDSLVMRVAAAPKGASLPSNHDAFKQGIYATNSVGDFD